MARVTLEGSNTPSTFLARGARITVERTSFVDKMIRRGFVTVIPSEAVSEPETADDVDRIVEESTIAEDFEPMVSDPPPVSATKVEWEKFLATNGIEYPEGATKSELIAVWRAAESTDG